jgi:hypothetical protein
LLVATLNFEVCSTPEAAVAYVGLDPVLHESGSSVWHPGHVGRGGHARLCIALYVASLSAARHNRDQHLLSALTRTRQADESRAVCRCAQVVAYCLGRCHQGPAVRPALP